MSSLESLGWDAAFASDLAALGDPCLEPARVIEHQRDLYRVTGSAGTWPTRLSGSLRQEGTWPAVGDWVAVENAARIRTVLTRRSSLVRKAAGQRTDAQVMAANVDTVFIVMSLDLDLNLRRLERYLALIWDGGAMPVVLLSKLDLCDDPESWIAEVQSAALGVPVLALSALHGAGVETMGRYLGPGQTVALVGSSGVGKSTLTNRLVGKEVMAVTQVRLDDGKGRHTTSHRELFVLPCGACLIDTPGLREVGTWNGDLGRTFQDVEELAGQCRFADCRHETEPGCAVRDAVDEERLRSWRKLRREQAHMDRKQDERLALEEHRRNRRLSRQRTRARRRGLPATTSDEELGDLGRPEP